MYNRGRNNYLNVTIILNNKSSTNKVYKFPPHTNYNGIQEKKAWKEEKSNLHYIINTISNNPAFIFYIFVPSPKQESAELRRLYLY